MASDYEADLSVWAERQAELLRLRAVGEVKAGGEPDWLNIANEIAAVSVGEKRNLHSRTARLLQNLLRWHYQPDHRSAGLRAMIDTQRSAVAEVLNTSPSLRGTMEAVIAAAYGEARRSLVNESGLLTLPEAAPFDVAQALDGELPED